MKNVLNMFDALKKTMSEIKEGAIRILTNHVRGTDVERLFQWLNDVTVYELCM